jgi:hypothetical protein
VLQDVGLADVVWWTVVAAQARAEGARARELQTDLALAVGVLRAALPKASEPPGVLTCVLGEPCVPTAAILEPPINEPPVLQTCVEGAPIRSGLACICDPCVDRSREAA